MKVDFVAGALPYAEKLGWRILLLGPGWKLPFIAKDKGGNGVYDATCDPEQIRSWGQLCPHGNIGAACGPESGFFVLDVDPRNQGDVSIRAMAAAGNAFPHGPRQRTGNGGWHLLFQHEDWLKNARGKLAKGIDVKKAGGFILVAPSWTRASEQGPGGSYYWEVSPFDVPIPRIPAWLKEKLLPPQPPPMPRGAILGPADIRPLVDHVAHAQNGNRNNALHWAVCRAAEAGALTSSAKAAFLAAALAAGEEKQKALSTIQSAARRERIT
ncbi:MAG: bifunctional DNA primase/polymerase [Rhodomicrobium sp.]